MLKIAIAGFGFMGRMHYAKWSQLDDVEVVAICDSNPALKHQAKGAVGNIAGAADTVHWDRLTVYPDLAQMLREADLDAVSITFPTFLHRDAVCQCLAAGLDVLCEKPMALTVADAEQMIAAARQSGRLLQVGQCLRFWPEYAWTKDAIASQRFGAVIAANFRRATPRPAWSNDNWLADAARSGGMILDLHIHDTDIVQYYFGRPDSVSAAAANFAGQPLHVATRYHYPDAKLVTAEGGWDVTESHGFFMAFDIMLEHATISYDSRRIPTLQCCPDDADRFAPELPDDDGYGREIEHFARTLRGQKLPAVITMEDALESMQIVEAEKTSIEQNKTIKL